jgi:hypothetical protein
VSDNRNDARDEFQRSVERLEKAVQGFVSATNEHVTNRAAEFVDDTAERLERELRSRRGQREDEPQSRSDSKRARRERYREARWERRNRRRQARWQSVAGTPGYRTARLFQDKRRQKIAGVCAGIAEYFGFDLAVTRFSGRRAPIVPDADPIQREGYSHEVISCGFWPGDRRYKDAAFYSYTAPAPAGLSSEDVRPEAGHWDTKLGEFILTYDDVLHSQSPQSDIIEFCQSTYEAGAKLAQWDRAALERTAAP